MKDRFISLLRQSGRIQDCDAVVNKLERIGFFDAPASTKYHLCETGGLLHHSLNVCDTAVKLRDTMIALDATLEERLPLGSVILCALLHDVCKSEIYKQGFRNRKNEQTGVWEKVPTFEVDYSRCPLGHGEKSVIRLLSWGVSLTMDEILAIRWHMAAWEIPFQSYESLGNLNAAREKSPLVTLLQSADMLASGLLERTEEEA